MSERRNRVSLRRWRPRGIAWSLLLLVVLAGALLVGAPLSERLRLANPDLVRVSELRSVLGQLPPQPLVLVGMDADLGTYPEIRPAVRALLADLLARESRIAMVSFSPEGRAIAAAEVGRLEAEGVPTSSLIDYGFVAGAEAGLVLSVTGLPDTAEPGNPLARTVRLTGGGIAAFDMAVVVGGIDFGPRSWVEQVATRLPSLPLVAVAPTFAQPELAPYLRTGQIAALLATVRDEVAYAADVAARSAGGDTATAEEPAGQDPSAMLIGMLAALVVIGGAIVGGGPRELEVEPEPEEAA